MILVKTLQKMLKLDLMLQIRNQIDHCLKEKAKSNSINENLLRQKNHEKTYSYFTDDGSDNKKAKGTKSAL